MMLSDRRLAVLAFALLVLLWGAAFPVIKTGLVYSPPILFAGIRTLICGVAVASGALFLWGGAVNLWRDWRVYLLLAAFNVVGFMGLQTLAVLYMPSGSAAVVIYLQPILVGLLSYVILDESLSVSKVAGLLLGFSGIVVVSVGSLLGSPLGTPLGVLFGAGSAISWALGTVYFKRYGGRLPMAWAVAVPFSVGGVSLLGLGFLLEPPSEISWNGTFIACLAYTSLVGTGLAWLLWLGLVRAGEASRVAAYVFFVPLISLLIGALFLGEPVGPSLLAGAALVVLGIYLVNHPGADGEKPKDPPERPLEGEISKGPDGPR